MNRGEFHLWRRGERTKAPTHVHLRLKMLSYLTRRDIVPIIDTMRRNCLALPHDKHHIRPRRPLQHPSSDRAVGVPALCC